MEKTNKTRAAWWFQRQKIRENHGRNVENMFPGWMEHSIQMVGQKPTRMIPQVIAYSPNMVTYGNIW